MGWGSHQILDGREEYRFRLFEKCGMAMTVDGSGDDRINLEGLDKPYTFMDAEDSSDDEGALEPGEGAGGGGDQRFEEDRDTSREGMEDGRSSDQDDHDTASGQKDELSLLDEDDTMDPTDEIHGMEIPDGFRLQGATPAALVNSLLQRGVLVRLSLGWFGGLITRQSQEGTRHLYEYRVHFELDQSTRSMKLALEKYSGDADAVVGSWVSLEGDSVEEGGDPTIAEQWRDPVTSSAVTTGGASRAGRTRTPNVTLVDH